MKQHLEEGLSALLDVIGSDAVSICESNSLRRVLCPGLFLMVKGRKSRSWKSSARDVKKYADRIVSMDSGSFDLDLDRIKIVDGKWKLREKATAIILAGGNSSRMGIDKSILLLNGRPIIEHICEQLRGTFEQILISADEVETFRLLGYEIIPDNVSGQGPLMGIASALKASANELNFVVACDIPHIDLAYVRRMLTQADGVDIVIPTTDVDKFEPLFAVYRKSTLKAINRVLSSGGRKISDVFAHCMVKYISLEAEQFTNLNTIAEYDEFRGKYSAKI